MYRGNRSAVSRVTKIVFKYVCLKALEIQRPRKIEGTAKSLKNYFRHPLIAVRKETLRVMEDIFLVLISGTLKGSYLHYILF